MSSTVPRGTESSGLLEDGVSEPLRGRFRVPVGLQEIFNSGKGPWAVRLAPDLLRPV